MGVVLVENAIGGLLHLFGDDHHLCTIATMKNEALVIEAALQAGADIMGIYAREFTVEEKEDKSPLTEADKKAHNTISSYLEKTAFPILSEEGKHMDFSDRKG